MKFQIVLAALAALVWSSTARSLKGSAQPELEAENEALKKKNKHLEAMMQLARAEVHRMDVARKHVGGNNVDTLNQEVDDLKAKLKAAAADKKSLVQTLRQLLSRNSTKIFQEQAHKAQQSKQALEVKFGQVRQSCENQVKEANGKHEEAKEMAQTLQEQNMDLQRTVQELRVQLATSAKTAAALKDDKANLVRTMHSLMRENSAVKKDLRSEKDNVKKEAQEIVVDEAKIEKLMKKPKVAKPTASKKTTRKVKASAKNAPLKLNHQESEAFKMAKLNHINEYMTRQYSADDNSDNAPNVIEAAESVPVAPAPKVLDDDWQSLTKQVDVVAKQEDVIAKKKQLSHAVDSPQAVADAAVLADRAGSAGLSDWLGLPKTKPVAIPKDADGMSPIDALDPEAVKQEKVAEAKKAKLDADDGGDGIEDLLAQAKDQLSAMDKAEAQDN